MEIKFDIKQNFHIDYFSSFNNFKQLIKSNHIMVFIRNLL
jgi:hypothetical protein